MNYAEWLKTVPAALTEDSVWKMEAYRLALFAADFAWHDVTKLMQMIPDQRERALHEDSPSYAAGPVEAWNGFPTHLLENIPLP